MTNLKISKKISVKICLLSAITVLFLLVWGLPVYAANSAKEEPNPVYETWLQTVYSRDSGLSAGEANDIVTTSDGIMWIGTYAGLYRYNGSNFQLMNQYEKVKNVNYLYVDDADNLFIGTNDNGLSVYHEDNLIGDLDSDKGLPSDSVRSIVKGANGYYYVGTSDSLVIVKMEEELKVVKVIDQIKYADQITADSSGNVVAISSYGNMYFLKDNQLVKEISSSESERFTACIFNEQNQLYVGTSLGNIQTYHQTDGNFTAADSKNCKDVGQINSLQIINHDLFVCGSNGVGYYDSSNQLHRLQVDHFANAVNNVIADYQGNLWFTSSRMGLLRLCNTNFVEMFKQFSVPSEVVNTVERFHDNLYVGTDSGLIIIDEKNNKRIENSLTAELDSTRIRHIYKDRQNHLWFCTYEKGLLEYSGQKLKSYSTNDDRIGNRVRTLLEHSNGDLYVSSEKGITILRKGKIIRNLTTKDGLINQISLCFLEKSNGNVLVGSDGDGIVEISDSKIVKTIGKEQGLSSGVILRMTKDAQNNGIFIITSNALCYLTEKGKITVLNHFPYSNNYDLIIDNDMVYVPSSAGVFSVKRDELLSNKVDMKFTLLDSKAGLLSSLVANSWALYEKNDRKLYLATSSGLTLFNLDNQNSPQKEFRAGIAAISIDGKRSKIDSSEKFLLSTKVNKLEIRPEVINFSTVDPLLSCYLEGVDKEPIVMAQSELTTLVYTNLHVGKYTFHISLVDPETGKTVSDRIYHLEKETTFRDTAWYYVMITLIIMGVATFIGALVTKKLYSRKIKLKEEELAQSRKQVEMGDKTIMAIAKAVDAKDKYTSQHSARVASYSVKIAKELGFDQEQCNALKKIALLHDIGKIGIPDCVLNKPGKLTDEEYEMMKSHVVRGAEILKGFNLVEHIDDGVRYHHERFDGKGYPSKLAAEEIPLTARIIGLADAFDAMTSNRIYRNKLDMDFVVEEIRRCSGTQFDPELAKILLSLIERGEIDPYKTFKKMKREQENENK